MSKNSTKSKRSKHKFNTELCNDTMTFEECELTILRHAVDDTTKLQGKIATNNEDIQKMILILENFLIRKKCICYGGTAINNILPKDVQFYDKNIEIPDYDFFSKNPVEDAKELSDIYYNQGFTDVEAKSGVHKGTYKVFVNFIPIADITFMNHEIYDNLAKESITILGIHYCPPNYLRMSMYLELSRPAGDVSRWEKVFKRLNLLNKYHPLKPHIDCKKVHKTSKEIEPNIFSILKDNFIKQGAVFFGGYATYLYSNYMPKNVKYLTNRIPEFDVIIENHDKVAIIIKERLEEAGFKNIELITHKRIEDIIPDHVELQINKKPYAFIYEPIACHNYNKVKIDKEEINIATIDTMLSFYLAFIYVNNKYYNKDRIICLAKYLYEVEEHNRLEQTNILKRFSVNCIGTQKGLSAIRAEKADIYKKLSNKKNTKEYEEWFFKYVPSQLTKKEQDQTKEDVEKYVEEDTDTIVKIKKDKNYGTESHPKSIIMKYKSKKYSPKSPSTKSPSTKSPLKFNEDFDNPHLYFDKDPHNDKDTYKKNRSYRKKSYKKKYTTENNTRKKTTFWKRFYKKNGENQENMHNKTNKSKQSWFSLF